jgi:hypothetical protein
MKAPYQKELFDTVKKTPKKPTLRLSPRPPDGMRDLRDAAEFHRRRCNELLRDYVGNFEMRVETNMHEHFADAIESALAQLAAKKGR